MISGVYDSYLTSEQGTLIARTSSKTKGIYPLMYREKSRRREAFDCKIYIKQCQNTHTHSMLTCRHLSDGNLLSLYWPVPLSKFV